MKIVILDGKTVNPGDLSWDAFSKLGDLIVYEQTEAHQVAARIEDAEIILTNKVRIGKEEMEVAKRLQYIGILATGYEIIDLAEAKKRGIVVTNVPGYSTDGVAQMVFALLLEACMHVGGHDKAVKQGKWANAKSFCFWDWPLTLLSGKTMGILGLGQIGKKVAQIAGSFGMKAVACSNTPKGLPNVKDVDFETLLAISDVLSLHVPLTSATETIIDHGAVERMKEGSILINTARGKIVDDDAILQGLNTGKIKYYLADVAKTEPPHKNNLLLLHQNVIVTPHIAWASIETRAKLVEIVYENLYHYKCGNIIHQVV